MRSRIPSNVRTLAFVALIGTGLLARSNGAPDSAASALPGATASGAQESGGQDRPRRPDRERRDPNRRSEPAGELNKPPLANSDEERKILSVLEAMWKDRSRRYLSVSETDGRLLRQLAEAVGAKRVVEVGMSTGYSTLWFSLALRATGGSLITHEVSAERIALARKNFKKAAVDNLITVVEGDAHETVKQLKEPIDVLFLDADKSGYIDYLNRLLPLVRPGGLIIAHNMRRPPPDPRFVEAITTNPALDTSFLLMDGAGVSVTLKKR